MCQIQKCWHLCQAKFSVKCDCFVYILSQLPGKDLGCSFHVVEVFSKMIDPLKFQFQYVDFLSLCSHPSVSTCHISWVQIAYIHWAHSCAHVIHWSNKMAGIGPLFLWNKMCYQRNWHLINGLPLNHQINDSDSI